MRYLVDIAEEYGLSRIVSRAMERQDVQGVLVDIDPLWLASWRAMTLGQLDSRTLDEWFYFYRRFVESLPSDGPFGGWSGREGLSTATRVDLSWRPPDWDSWSQARGLPDQSPPLIVKVILSPNASPVTEGFGEERLRVVFETRPLARLSYGPKSFTRPLLGGISVGTIKGVAGTLGGVVRDAGGRRLGLTCSHVLPLSSLAVQPASTDSPRAKRIGHVTLASSLTPSPPGCKCSPYDPNCKFNEIDVSAVDLDEDIPSLEEVFSIGRITGATPASAMAPTLAVEVAGRTSGYRALQVGCAVAAFKFSDNLGTVYCFKNLFEVRWPSFSRLLLGRPISAGDSGAWVCTQGKTGTEWCGMVLGDDRVQGYACLSSSVEDWLRSNGFQTEWA